jgi:titin
MDRQNQSMTRRQAAMLRVYILTLLVAFCFTAPGAEAVGAMAPEAPPVPQNFRTTTITSSSVGLAWNDVSNEEKYQVMKRLGATNVPPTQDAQGWELVTDRPANTTSYTVTPLLPGVTYSFAVIAVNRDGFTSTLPIVAVTAQPPPPAVLPAAPSNLQASVQSSTSIRITWRDNSNNETGFVVMSLPPTGLAVFQTIATLPAGATSFTHTGLTAGTRHTYKVCATLGDERHCSTESVSVTLPEPPPPPNNLRATAAQDVPVVRLEWERGGGLFESDGPVEGFRIFRRDGGKTSFNLIETVSSSTTSYTDDFFFFPPSRTFTYRVTAFNNAASSSRDVNIALPERAAAPTSVRARAVGPNSIVIEWSPSPGATLHLVQMNRSGRFETVHSARTGGLFAHNNHGVPSNTDVTYRVCAINGGGANCSPVTVRTPIGVPPEPQGLTGLALSASQIRLIWRDSSDSNNRTEGFIIRRGRTRFDYRTIANAATEDFLGGLGQFTPGTFSYVDSGLEQNTSYGYEVIARNSSGQSPPATVAIRTVSLEPAAPINLQATALSSSEIRITWQDTASNETGFRVEQLVAATGTYVQVGAAGANGTSCTITGLLPNTRYVFRVCAVNGSFLGCSTTTTSATTLAQVSLAPPSGLKTFNITATSIGVTWVDNSSGETGFRIELMVNGVFTTKGTTAANTQNFAITGLQPNTTYEFRVCAVSGSSAQCSASKTATTASN